jgi:hypothetical protein
MVVRIEVVVDRAIGTPMQMQRALPRGLSGAEAFPRVSKILHLQLAQLLAAQRVEQQGR